MFLVTFKTEKKVFHLAEPQPVLSQMLINVTSTKYILELEWTPFHKSPLGNEGFQGKFSNFSLKRSSSSCIFVTFINVYDKAGFGSVS